MSITGQQHEEQIALMDSVVMDYLLHVAATEYTLKQQSFFAGHFLINL
jgi:hypothetical protein